MSPTKKVAKAVTKPAAKKAPARRVVAKKVVAKKTVSKKIVKKQAAARKPAAKARKAAVCVPTELSVDAHIGAITDPGRRQDCRSLVEVFSAATGKPARMW